MPVIEPSGCLRTLDRSLTRSGRIRQSLEGALRYAHANTKVPLYVTENGIGTSDDKIRTDYIRRPIQGVANCLKDGIGEGSYVHWSLLDNFKGAPATVRGLASWPWS